MSFKNSFFDLCISRAARMLGKPARLAKLLGQLALRLYQTDWKQMKAETIRDKYQVLSRMTQAFVKGHYRSISQNTIIAMVAAFIYFISPLDLVPDLIPGLGLLDDFAVLTWVYNSCLSEIEKFIAWEKKRESIAI